MSEEIADATVVTGAERLEAAFATAKSEGRAALMPYMMGGFPDTAGATAVANAYVDGGADLIELGVPFSDPLADGPVIHAAATAALTSGAHFEDVLSTCRNVSPRIPVVLMVYTNTVLGVGPDEFARRAIDAGASGVIIPDLPWGEDDSIIRVLSDHGLGVVPLIAPTTLPDRRAEICAAARGFVYVVSTVGTTGEANELPADLTELVGHAKDEASAPVAVGFGIGTPGQAAQVGRIADGVIIGSRLVRAVSEADDSPAAVEAVTSFLTAARQAMAGSESA